jgi:UDP-N-acetylglucosamine acyltransferase
MSSNQIHPTAIVDPGAELGPGVEVGPYCLIGAGVRVGAGTVFKGHVVVDGPTQIGENNLFYPFGAIGQRSQDLKYRGEPTYLEIGNGNTFREFVTIHRATAPEGRTRIGHRGNFLAYSHIAHDCLVGDDVIFSNNGTLAGHVTVEDHVIISGLSAVHQFCRIGRHAILGGCSKIVQDVPPFMIADGNPAAIRGINKVGLERANFEKETLLELKEAYRLLYRSDLNTAQAVQRIKESLRDIKEIRQIIEFIEASQRGIVR